MYKDFVPFSMDKKYRKYGDSMITAVYNGVEYELSIADKYKNGYLYSDKAVNDNSVEKRQGEFETKIDLTELDDIFSYRIYAEYKGRIYCAGYVSDEFAEIDLLNCTLDDSGQTSFYYTASPGFKFSSFYMTDTLTVSRNEISRLLAAKRSIFQDTLMKKAIMEKKSKGETP